MIIQTNDDLAKDIAKGIKKIANQNGKHTSIKKMAKMTDLREEQLSLAVSKLSGREKKRMLNAFTELDRVVHAIALSDKN